MILIDTSAWIACFRAQDPIDLESFLDLDEVVTCLPVVQEVLQGFRHQSDYLLARSSLLAFPMLESPLRQEVFLEAVELYRTARRAGITLRSSVDCLIAACAIRNSVSVLHRDRDYSLLAQVAPLEQRNIHLESGG